MPRGLAATFGFFGGFALGWGASMALYVLGESGGLWRDRDGGIAMAFGFTLGPLVGLVAGVLLARWLWRRAGRAALNPPEAG